MSLGKFYRHFQTGRLPNKRLRDNPVSPVKRFKAQKAKKVKRRSSFTLEELQSIYDESAR